MACTPTLYTPRLRLRPFALADGPRVQELAGDKRIAAMTSLIPHPYLDGAAEAWIEAHESQAVSGRQFTFAITLAGTRTPGRENDLTETGHLIGSICLSSNGTPDDERAELGYWIGVPYWNKGFATEAARVLFEFGFVKRGLHRIIARHFAHNPASGRVMVKLGMTREALLRAHERKWDEFVDVVIYGILRDEWATQRKTPRFITRSAQLQPT